ncbi:hypothetical protein GCM10009682_61420 [Luedemannella flava]|uniref:DUF885 domain-containing protein n=1 Tax=Luedemannella flava TaxID=349316 RepID=A0ABN2MQK0_9ACTN
MNLRDEIERVLRSWDAHERQRGATPIIDYDFCPTDDEAEPAGSRLEVYERLGGLLDSTDPVGNRYIISRLNADLAYLRALMGERDPLPTYIAQTQGCAAAGWSPDYVTAVGALARDELSAFDIPWDASTSERWEKLEGPLTVDDAATAIRRATNQYEPAVREVVGTTAPFDLAIETVNVDAYWAYWLDGAGSNARLRLNLRHARFTEVVARQFAFHEVLGHALQGASMYARASQDDVPWVRLLSVHAPQQVLFEGLAQALPLFVVPDDRELAARVRVAHYLQLVRAELHLAINAGASASACAAHARDRVPFWDDAQIADALSDRGVNPQLRSYLWAYPAGIDWFVRLADDEPVLGRDILHAAYRDPLTPAELAALWPTGPRVGGTGGDQR